VTHAPGVENPAGSSVCSADPRPTLGVRGSIDVFDLIWRLVATSAVVIVAAVLVYATSWPVLAWLVIYALGVLSIWRIYIAYFRRRS
jgi:hypothetical protein